MTAIRIKRANGLLRRGLLGRERPLPDDVSTLAKLAGNSVTDDYTMVAAPQSYRRDGVIQAAVYLCLGVGRASICVDGGEMACRRLPAHGRRTTAVVASMAWGYYWKSTTGTV